MDSTYLGITLDTSNFPERRTRLSECPHLMFGHPDHADMILGLHMLPGCGTLEAPSSALPTTSDDRYFRFIGADPSLLGVIRVTMEDGHSRYLLSILGRLQHRLKWPKSTYRSDLRIGSLYVLVSSGREGVAHTDYSFSFVANETAVSRRLPALVRVQKGGLYRLLHKRGTSIMMFSSGYEYWSFLNLIFSNLFCS